MTKVVLETFLILLFCGLPLAPWPARVLRDSGLTFTAWGVQGSSALYLVLTRIVANGGPVPLTPAVIVGLGLWLAFMVVVLVHTCVDGILIVCGERPIQGPVLRFPSFFRKKKNPPTPKIRVGAAFLSC
jgi:hypothetical protein